MKSKEKVRLSRWVFPMKERGGAKQEKRLFHVENQTQDQCSHFSVSKHSTPTPPPLPKNDANIERCHYWWKISRAFNRSHLIKFSVWHRHRKSLELLGSRKLRQKFKSCVAWSVARSPDVTSNVTSATFGLKRSDHPSRSHLKLTNVIPSTFLSSAILIERRNYWFV